VFVVGAQVRLVLDCNQDGHIESATQVVVAGLGDANFLMDRGSRGVLARVESGVGDSLANLHARRSRMSSASRCKALVAPTSGMESSNS
jgi:hypothetical protein